MAKIFEFEFTTIDGDKQRLDAYRNQALLIVNVASRCGFTPQYAGLQNLYLKYRERGFTILGFPCDQFGHQEPAAEDEIKSFCTRTYEVSFPMSAKIAVNGAAAHPLYRYLKAARRGVFWTKSIKWNFTKFLVDRDWNVVRRYAPFVSAQRIERDLLQLLPTR